MPRAAVIIPARLRSSRLPGKMLLSRTGFPLVVHTAARAREAAEQAPGLVSGVLVAADSEEIASAAREHGFSAVLTSPEHRSGSDRLAEAASGIPEEIVVNLQGDEPETPPSVIIAVIRALLAAPDCSAATCAYPIEEKDLSNPDLVKVVRDREGRALYFSRAGIPFRRPDRPSAQPRALGHIGIYAYRKEALLSFPSLPRGPLEQMEALEQLRFLENGHGMAVTVVPPVPKGIDTEEDYEDFVSRYERSGRDTP